MIFITGDTHGDFTRFKQESFPEQKQMTKEDYIIICGDFGGVWDTSPRQDYWVDWLDKKPFTTLFITGNHENYDLLKEYEVADYRGGKAQFIRPTVIHLMRRQVFTIDGKRFFTMGGASCHDVDNGILSADDPNFELQKKKLTKKGGLFRIDHLSWWKEELPGEEEYNTARENLEKAEYAVDHIITHCPPESIRLLLELLGANGYPKDSLTDFLELVEQKVRYSSWFFGHYHGNAKIIDKHYLLYDDIVPLLAIEEHFESKRESVNDLQHPRKRKRA